MINSPGAGCIRGKQMVRDAARLHHHSARSVSTDAWSAYTRASAASMSGSNGRVSGSAFEP